MITLHENKTFDATISSSTEASGFEWDTALNDIRLSRVGRTTSDTTQWLKFAYSTVQTVDYVAIMGHNLSPDATIVLEGNNSDSWGSPSFSETISLASNGNFYNNYRNGDGKIYQDITNRRSGTAPAEFDHYNDNNYGTQNLEEGSIYDSLALDLKNHSEITWDALGSVNILFRDSADGLSWSSWTAEADATISTRRTKVLRYMQYRLFFNSPAWGDVTSYFELLSPLTETFPIITSSVTQASYKWWRVTITDPENTDGYIEIGGLYLGVSMVWPGKITNIIAPRTTSEYSKSATGQIYPTNRIQLKYAEISFNGVAQSDENNVKSFNETVDITLPFVLLIWENNLDIQPALYVNQTEMIAPNKENSDHVSWGYTMKVEECK